MNELLTVLLDTIQSVDPALRTVLAGIAIMLETSALIGMIVPGDTIVIVSGTAVASPVEAVILGIVVVLGALTGESIGFWLGRILGPRIHHSWLGRRIGERNWHRSERYLRRRGGLAIFISRFLPVLHSLIPLTVGMSGYSYRRFLFWTTPACILWSSLYITVSSLAAGTYREFANQLRYAGYFFVGGVLLVALVAYAAKKLLHRVERKHFDHDDDANHTGAVNVKD